MTDKLLQKINSIDRVVGRLTYGGATLYKHERKLSVLFNSSKAQDKELSAMIAELLREELPKSFEIEVVIRKIVTEPEFVVKAVIEFLRSNHRIACASIKEENVNVVKNNDVVLVEISCEKTTCEFCEQKNVGKELETALAALFADEFMLKFIDTGFAAVSESDLIVKKPSVPVAFTERRTLKVEDVTKFMEEDNTDEATYICDAKDMLGEVYLAGTITNVRELVTKTEKPYFIIDFTDKTGMISGTIFPNKDKIPKLRKLDKEVDIIARCEFQMRGEYKNLRIHNISLCVFPKNFVPKEREKRPVPKDYSLIFPKPYEYETQDNFLEDKTPPECFKGRSFVVFDLETTGTDFDDKITEIGAVKLIDGKMTEYFTTLINPQKHITTEVVNLTGIDDEMVKDAPLYDYVCADFYKFCYGSTLVGHNVEFDIRFIKNQSKPLDYIFDNPLMDTLAIGRECIYGVANYKLNTLCDKFGIVFRHHRAFSDAAATAELFIELIRIKGKLPF